MTLLALVIAGAAGDPVPRADLALDGAITLSAAAAAGVLFFMHPVLARTECPCDRRDLYAIDRAAVPHDWPLGEPFADMVLTLAVAGPMVATAARSEHSREVLNDALLIAESASLAALATQIAKTAVARPYPYMYERTLTAEQLRDGDNYASFWSGHTAVAMAAGVTFAGITWRRDPDSPWRIVALLMGPVLAAAAGALQLSAGNHFPTDIAAGAAVGALTGAVNTWLHL